MPSMEQTIALDNEMRNYYVKISSYFGLISMGSSGGVPPEYQAKMNIALSIVSKETSDIDMKIFLATRFLLTMHLTEISNNYGLGIDSFSLAEQYMEKFKPGRRPPAKQGQTASTVQAGTPDTSSTPIFIIGFIVIAVVVVMILASK